MRGSVCATCLRSLCRVHLQVAPQSIGLQRSDRLRRGYRSSAARREQQASSLDGYYKRPFLHYFIYKTVKLTAVD